MSNWVWVIVAVIGGGVLGGLLKMLLGIDTTSYYGWWGRMTYDIFDVITSGIIFYLVLCALVGRWLK